MKEKALLTVREAGKLLRVDESTIRRWIKQGILHAIELPHRNDRKVYRVKREAISKILGE